MMIERDIRYKTAMMNLKSHCSAEKSSLHDPNDLFRRFDTRGTGSITRIEFVGGLQHQKIMSIDEINTLANYYQKTFSNMVNYSQLVSDMGSLKNTQNEASNVIVTDQIKKYCQKNDITFKSLFDEFSVDKQMNSFNLDRLIKRTDLLNFNQMYVSSYIASVDKHHHGYLTYFEIVGSFDHDFQAIEFSKMLKSLSYDKLYDLIKKDVEAEKQTIVNKFTFCKSPITFSEELNKLPSLSQASSENDTAGFARLFTSLQDSIALDYFALDTLESAIGKTTTHWLSESLQFSTAKPEEATNTAPTSLAPPDTSSKALTVPGTTFTFEELKKLRRYVNNLNKMAVEQKVDPLKRMASYEGSKKGVISDANFERFIDKDLDIEVSRYKKNVENMKKYGRAGEGMIDYKKLWGLLKEDLDKKENKEREKVEKEFKENVKKEEKKKKEEQKEIVTLSNDQKFSVRQKIIRGYLQAGTPKEALLDKLIPSGSYEANIDKLAKKIHNDIKDVELGNIKSFLSQATVGKHTVVTKEKLKELLYEDEMQLQRLDTVSLNDQIDTVFRNVDIEGKNQLTRQQAQKGSMQLGLNVSTSEMDSLFDDFKDKDTQVLDQRGFTRMIEHQYSKDIMKERAVRDRFNEVLEKVDPFRTHRLKPVQLKSFYSQLYPESNNPVKNEEIDALMRLCGVTEGSISAETLKNAIVAGQTKFGPQEDDLANSLMKLRSGLYCSLGEQYRNFMFMPNNFVQSFTEASYEKSLNHLPTSTVRPSLGEGKLFYNGLYPPVAGQEHSSHSKFSKYLKLSKTSDLFEINLERASGVPIPDDILVSYSEIVGREIRISLFEENSNKLQANTVNLQCRWTPQYEDRYYFDVNKISNETKLLVKVPQVDLINQNKKYYLLFELVNFVKKNESSGATAMSAGYAMQPLFNLDKTGGKVLDILGGSPYKDKSVQILPEEVRHKRRGFIPKVVSIFEGKVKPKLSLSIKKISPTARSSDAAHFQLLPDEGVYHWPQLKIYSCFRQCLGRDAFAFLGSVTSSVNMHLTTEAYVNSFCNLMSISSVAITIADFWNTNVLKVFANDSYELRMDSLKAIFNFLYPLLNSVNFEFNRPNPTDMRYENSSINQQRLAYLRDHLSVVFTSVQTRREASKIAPPKFRSAVSKLADVKSETRHTAFSIDELLDEDIDQI